jgi:hypothetical protein
VAGPLHTQVAFAEKDSEAMRLAQRLKRSLVSEGVARDEVEELKRRLAVVAPDEVGQHQDKEGVGGKRGSMQQALLGWGVGLA